MSSPFKSIWPDFQPLPDDPEPYRYSGAFMAPENLDELLLLATKARASDINLVSDQIVRLKIAGIQRPFTLRPLTVPDIERVLRELYAPQAVSLLNAGHDIDGSYEILPKGDDDEKVRFRYNATGGRNAAQITLRTLPAIPPPLLSMNVPEPVIKALRPKSGLVYIAGPTGSGKSTLMASIFRYLIGLPDDLDAGFINSGKLIFFEKPIEFVYDDLLNHPRWVIHQAELGRHLRPEHEGSESDVWAYAVRNALRRTPEIAVVGEARDAATIRGCIELGLSGHLTYGTIHSIGVPETIRRASIVFPAEERLGASVDLLEMLHMVVTQILVPRIAGGQVPVREYAIFNPAVKSELLRSPLNDWPEKLRELIRAGRMECETLVQCADRHLRDGIISLETRNRVAVSQEEAFLEAMSEVVS